MQRIAHLAILAVLLLTGARATDAPRWDFETGLQGWRPRADSIRLEPVVTQRERKGAGALHLSGAIDVGWNYALSPTVPLAAGKLYRLTARMRVDALGDGTPPPYLLAVEKGTDGAASVDLLLDDVTLVEIDHLTNPFRLDPIPPPLEKLRGVHPRIYLDASRVAKLREAVATTHKVLWERLKPYCDRAAKSGPPAYRERDSYSGDEQLWQREVGNAMPYLALAWLLTSDRSYLDAARAWALASCSYQTWGLGAIDGMDLATGHQTFGLALVYDWCYHDLDAATLQTIRETLIRRVGKQAGAAASGSAWWSRSYLQNHLWVNLTGIAAAGFTLFDEHDDALTWIGLALAKYRTTLDSLGDDGASHEGVGYWGYGVENLLKFMDLARSLLGVELYDHPWFRNTAAYRQYLALPRDAWTRANNIVDIADCPRSNWYGPDYLLRRLAAEYRDPHAQWLAEQLDVADVNDASALWLNLLWFDPALAPAPPADLPTARWFRDLDLVSCRSDWSGAESLLVFKCGPFIGHHGVRHFSYDPGGGHVHPDANHFVLFGGGEWLVRDDGYAAKWTAQHNTLLVDGAGQMGEGAQWFKGSEPLAVKAAPKILAITSTAALDHLVGDATAAYPPNLGLRRYVRHLLFLKPDVLIVCDDIAADGPHELELRIFNEQPPAAQVDGSFLATGKRAVLRVTNFTPDGVTAEVAALAVRDRQGKELAGGRPGVRVATRRAAWRNAVALSWAAVGQAPPTVSLEMEGERWRFVAGGRSVTLDWTTGGAQSTGG
ncbi:MAG: DUF4962 domain-containing protein [Armatimonadetes bacterium]|nr:DUF4962 domain-containing protein [Armatimonadota bacterium]